MPSYAAAAFIFDMDGTLVDNMAYHRQSWLAFFAEMSVEMTPDRLERLMGSRTTPELLRQVLGPQTSDGEIAAYSQRKEAIYRALYGPHLRAVEGVGRFLQDAHHLGVPMAVATSAGEDNIEFTLGGLGIRSYFDAVVGGDDVPGGKEGPEIYLTAARRLAVTPGRCLAFEDSPSGVESAHLAGMRVIVVATNPGAKGLQVHPAVLDVVSDLGMLEAANLAAAGGSGGARNLSGPEARLLD